MDVADGNNESAEQKHRRITGNGNLRPPWKPGQSGNPGGRPKGKSIKAAVRKMLEEGLDGRDIREVLGKVGIKRAMEGDFRFWLELWNLMHDEDDLPNDGRPDAPVDAVAFPSSAIPPVPRPDEVQAGAGGEADGQDGDGEAEAGGGVDRKPDDPAPVV